MNDSTFKTITLSLALVLLLHLGVAAANNSEQAQPAFLQNSQEQPKDSDKQRPEGPKQCTSQETCDADGGCPEDAALGCSCLETPHGTTACIPRCDTDADCPNPPGLTLICKEKKNICVPEKQKFNGQSRGRRQRQPGS